MTKTKTKKKKWTSSVVTSRQPLADKVLKKMRGIVGAKVVELSAVAEGKGRAEALQQTVASSDELAGFHPAHGLYVYAQNQTSVMAEQLTLLPETDRLRRLLASAEDEYMPSGPPMSPLTSSFFTCWAFFDACVGVGQETIGTTTMAVGKAFGMDDELLRVIGLMQASRMAVYVHEGNDGEAVMLRELVTNRVCRSICPSGYAGHAGELWYARVLPSPCAGVDEHVVFTTPYILLAPDERGWLEYFDRTLPRETQEKFIDAYHRHMKWGPNRNHWNEFVMQAYVNHSHDVIFLSGLPDIPESLPHSPVNS